MSARRTTIVTEFDMRAFMKHVMSQADRFTDGHTADEFIEHEKLHANRTCKPNCPFCEVDREIYRFLLQTIGPEEMTLQ